MDEPICEEHPADDHIVEEPINNNPADDHHEDLDDDEEIPEIIK